MATRSGFGFATRAVHSGFGARAHGGALRRPAALVLGAEGKGMRQLTRKTCDVLVRIPMLGAVESLNVSMVSGMCLYEARRQRGN